MLEKKLHKSSDDWKYVFEPPNPTSIFHMPYLKGYETHNLVLFDGRKGSPKEHISRFIDLWVFLPATATYVSGSSRKA